MRWSRFVSAYGGYPFALLAVALATVMLLPVRAQLSSAQVMLLYVPVIIGVARASGVRASLAASVTAFLLIDLAFVAPYWALSVGSAAEWLGLLVFLAVAAIAGEQTGRLRDREHAAVERQRELELLNRLSARLVSSDDASRLAASVVDEISAVLEGARVSLYAHGETGVQLLGEAGPGPADVHEEALAGWVVANAKAVGLPPTAGEGLGERPPSVAADEALPDMVAEGVLLPLQSSGEVEGALCARPAAGGFSAEQVRLLVSVASLASVAVERRRLAEEATRVAALREADRLKSTFVSSVSHELKTPLAAVTARVTGLLDEGEGCDSARVHEELLAVSEDLGRLDQAIGDLIDVSRLESDAWHPRTDLYDVREVLGTVASRLPQAQRERVRFDLPSDLPVVLLDFSQWVRAFTHLMENALAYSPVDTEVAVGAHTGRGELVVTIEDRGPGVPDGEKQRIFEKFYRGSASASSPSGTGLGLAIVREIARAHHGSVQVEDAHPYGARFVVTLPVKGDRP